MPVHFFVVIDDESGERSVCVLLAGEESEITFLDAPPDHMIVSCSVCVNVSFFFISLSYERKKEKFIVLVS